MQVLISIGSNQDSLHNVKEAIHLLSQFLYGACVTPVIVTTPFGSQYRNDFHNCLLRAETFLSLDILESRLKHIERLLGRTFDSKSTGVVPIDIDILQYGNDKYHLRDWQRPYVAKLLELPFVSVEC